MSFNDLPKKFKKTRETLQLTQEQMAIRLQVTIATYVRWEHGISFPRKRYFERLEEAFLQAEELSKSTLKEAI